jgi:hypothetical protein
MITTTFTIELDIGLSYLLRSALPLASDRSRDENSSSGRSKRSYGHCRRRTENPEAGPSTASQLRRLAQMPDVTHGDPLADRIIRNRRPHWD